MADHVTDLLLVGASGLAREALAVVRSTGSHRVVGILDDDPGLHGSVVGGVRVVGGLDTVAERPDAQLLICIGKGTARERVTTRFARHGVTHDRYATVIHPSVDLPTGCTIEAGSIVLAQVAITADARLGRHVVLMPHVTVTHDDLIDDFATLAAGVSLGGGVRVGKRAYLGMNASVRERLSVGKDAVLGMGAVLVHDVPDGEVWLGVPARPMHQHKAPQ